MDKVSKYKDIVEEVVIATGNLGEQDDNDPIKTSFIMDRERGHYLLYFILHHDGTDLDIGGQIEEKGVLASDSVLAFIAPYRRKDTGYAVT